MRAVMAAAVLAACSVKPVTFTPEGDLPAAPVDAAPSDQALSDTPPVDPGPGDAAPVDAPPAVPMFAIEVELIGDGAGVVTASAVGLLCPGACTISVPAGTPIDLVASPAARSTFGGWGDGCTGTSACSFVATADRHVTARMTAVPQLELTVTLLGSGSGTVRLSPPDRACTGDCTQSYDVNTVVTLTPSASPGSGFFGWSGDCAGSGACELTMQRAMSVSAAFSLPGRLVTIDQQTDRLQRLDPLTGTVIDVGPLGVSYDFGDCAWHAGLGALYVVDARGDRSLYRVSLETGAATLVGVHGIREMFSLAYHPPSNQLYAIGGDNGMMRLYRLDAATGEATVVGPLGLAASFVDGLAWDSKRNRMIANLAGSPLQFYTIDLSTGAATLVATAGQINNDGMTYDPVADRFWLADFDARVLQIDPDSFAAIEMPEAVGQHTCLAFVP